MVLVLCIFSEMFCACPSKCVYLSLAHFFLSHLTSSILYMLFSSLLCSLYLEWSILANFHVLVGILLTSPLWHYCQNGNAVFLGLCDCTGVSLLFRQHSLSLLSAGPLPSGSLVEPVHPLPHLPSVGQRSLLTNAFRAADPSQLAFCVGWAAFTL